MGNKFNEPDMQYGDGELTNSELDFNNARVRLNFWIQGDIYLKIEEAVRNKGGKFQDYLEDVLTNAILNKDIEKRLRALEKTVFKKTSQTKKKTA